MTSSHVGGGPCLVDEDEALQIEISLAVEPIAALPQDVGPVLLILPQWRSRRVASQPPDHAEKQGDASGSLSRFSAVWRDIPASSASSLWLTGTSKPAAGINRGNAAAQRRSPVGNKLSESASINRGSIAVAASISQPKGSGSSARILSSRDAGIAATVALSRTQVVAAGRPLQSIACSDAAPEIRSTGPASSAPPPQFGVSCLPEPAGPGHPCRPLF